MLVTGANGFAGRHLCEALEAHNRPYRMLIRNGAGGQLGAAPVYRMIDFFDQEALLPALSGCHAVIHLAARVHMMEDYASDPLANFRRVNVEGTRSLARSAVEVGVKRVVFVSSVKVNGASTSGAPFQPSDSPEPQDLYGLSKWEAEQCLWEIADESGLEVVILRPPLMYGAGVKANFLRLMRLVHRGVPLPLGSIRNRRSLLFVRNLADAAVIASEHPLAAGETFLVSDGRPVSTAELVRALAAALDRRANLFPIPPPLLRIAGALIGRQSAVERLLDSLEVDNRRISELLGWSPPYTMHDGLEETAEWLMSEERAEDEKVQ